MAIYQQQMDGSQVAMYQQPMDGLQVAMYQQPMDGLQVLHAKDVCKVGKGNRLHV